MTFLLRRIGSNQSITRPHQTNLYNVSLVAQFPDGKTLWHRPQCADVWRNVGDGCVGSIPSTPLTSRRERHNGWCLTDTQTRTKQHTISPNTRQLYVAIGWKTQNVLEWREVKIRAMRFAQIWTHVLHSGERWRKSHKKGSHIGYTAPYRLVKVNQSFGGIFRFHLQDKTASQTRDEHEAGIAWLVPPKRQRTYNGLYGIILFTAIAV
jgi:hypothetical protein